MGRKAAIITGAIAASLLSAAVFAGAFFWHMDDGGNDSCLSGAGDAITAAVASAAGDAAYDAGINAISLLVPMKSDSGNPFEYDVDGTTCWVIPGSASAEKALKIFASERKNSCGQPRFGKQLCKRKCYG